MKFGIQHCSFSFDGRGREILDSLRTLVTKAESVGFDSFWVMDHFHQIPYLGPPEAPMLESWTTLATMAALTERIKLGTLVTGIVYRYPAVLAKMGASLDVLSKGRLFMGIGAAWNADEAKAYGISFPRAKERLKRLDEAVQIVRKMWTEEPATFEGQFYRIHNAYCNPKPIQKPHPPIMIGGAGERETLRIVAKHGDACNVFGSPQTAKKKLDVIREHCRKVGRDYDSILKTRLGVVAIDKDRERLRKRIEEEFKDVPEEMRKEQLTYGTPEEVRSQVEAFREAGIQYFIASFEIQLERQEMQLFADEVIRNF